MRRLISMLMVCVGLMSGCGSLEGKPPASTAVSLPTCSQAPRAQADIEHGQPAAIDATVASLAHGCYEGAQLESVEGALAAMLSTHANAVFAAMHRHSLDADLIGETVSGTPAGFVDDPCGLADELARRIAAITAVTGFERERGAALARLQEIHAAVAADCRSMNPAAAPGGSGAAK